jgi:hypothetical protein
MFTLLCRLFVCPKTPVTVAFRYLTTRIYSFSFFSYFALKALSTIKCFALCGSVVQLSCQPSLSPYYILKLESCFVFLLAEVSAPNGSFIKIKSEPSQLSRVSERFFLSRWVIRQYSGLDGFSIFIVPFSYLSSTLVPVYFKCATGN